MKQTIKMILGYKDMTISDLADSLGKTRPNLSQMLTRDDFRESDLRAIAAALGCDLEIAFIDRETGRRF